MVEMQKDCWEQSLPCRSPLSDQSACRQDRKRHACGWDVRFKEVINYMLQDLIWPRFSSTFGQRVSDASPGYWTYPHFPYDAVVIALGAGAKGDIRAQGTRHVIQAMRNHGVRRLICLSSLGVGESRGNLNFFWKYVMFGMLLRRAFADHVAQAIVENHVLYQIRLIET